MIFAESNTVAEFEINGDIEERCPIKYDTKRNDVSYGEFVHATYYSETCGMERGYSILLPADYSESVLPYDNFINDLVNDLMPHIEKEYSVLTGRDNTYLAGFSMGGRETIFITLQRPELFGYVCAISAAPGIVPAQDNFMKHDGQISESEMRFAEGAIEPNVFIICCGTRDSVVGTFPKQYHELLETNGSDHIWYEINGADHDNTAIKSGLYNLFKQIAYDKSTSQD